MEFPSRVKPLNPGRALHPRHYPFLRLSRWYPTIILMNSTQSPFLVWFDTEYTTLELESAHLIQVAMVITDMAGRRIAAAEHDLVTPVRLPEDAFVSKFVEGELASQLKQARSGTAPTIEDVDQMLVQRLEELTGPCPEKVKERPILAGNTIHADWWMAKKFLPHFLERLHYRNLDVSVLKILWLESKRGPEFDKDNISLLQDHLPGWTLPSGAKKHDALYDVMASVAELNYYRQHLLRA